MSIAMPINNLKTFGLTSCRDVLAKLDRELARLDTARTLEDACDHSTNAAISAWHLVEWTWSALKKDKQLSDRITNANDLGVRWREIDEFKKWLLEHGCSELRHCQMITNSFKHLDRSSKPRDPDFATQRGPLFMGQVTLVSATGEPKPIYVALGNYSEWYIIEDDKKYLINSLLKAVQHFWHTFLNLYAIS
jgi:hypothetical protein